MPFSHFGYIFSIMEMFMSESRMWDNFGLWTLLLSTLHIIRKKNDFYIYGSPSGPQMRKSPFREWFSYRDFTVIIIRMKIVEMKERIITFAEKNWSMLTYTKMLIKQNKSTDMKVLLK